MSTDNAWPLAQQATDYTIRHVRTALPDRVLPDSTVVVREGRIAAIEQSYRGTTADLDGSGALLLPGLVDVHTDALEKERIPRPGTALPWEFSLASFESKLVAAGITTVFHGAGFQHHTATGNDRSVELALQMCELVDAAPRHRVDHRILHRVDIRSADDVDALAPTWSATSCTRRASGQTKRGRRSINSSRRRSAPSVCAMRRCASSAT